MKAADIMTAPVIAVTPETGIAEAGRLMLQHRISGLPVADETGALVGIITEGDLLRRAETGTAAQRPRWLELFLGSGRLAADYVGAHGRKVGELMTVGPATVTPATPLAEIVALMERHRIKRVPVVDRGRLVGIVSRANLVGALVAALGAPAPAAGGDDGIRAHILAEIDKEPWAPRATVDVAVAAGEVDLYGTVLNQHESDGLRVIAENAPGVKRVRNHIVWVDPATGIVIPSDEEADKPAR